MIALTPIVRVIMNVIVLKQYPVRERSMPKYLDWAGVVGTQKPLLRNIGTCMIMHSLVDARDILHVRDYRAYIVRNQNDSTLY